MVPDPKLQDNLLEGAETPDTPPSLPLEGSISRREVSTIISRAILPLHNPDSADYTRVNTQDARDAIQQTLEEAENVQRDAVHIFDLDGHVIIVSTSMGSVQEMTIEQPAPVHEQDDYRISMRLEFDDHSSSIEIVEHHQGSTSPSRRPFPEEFEGFLNTINGLTEQFSKPADSVDQLVEKELYEIAKKAPEERRNGGISPGI